MNIWRPAGKSSITDIYIPFHLCHFGLHPSIYHALINQSYILAICLTYVAERIIINKQTCNENSNVQSQLSYDIYTYFPIELG